MEIQLAKVKVKAQKFQITGAGVMLWIISIIYGFLNLFVDR